MSCSMAPACTSPHPRPTWPSASALPVQLFPTCPVVPMGVALTQGPIDTSIWDAPRPARPRGHSRTRSCLRSSPVSQPTARRVLSAAGPLHAGRAAARRDGHRRLATAAGIQVRGTRDTHPRRRRRSALPPRNASSTSRPPTTGTRRLAGCTASSVGWIASSRRSPCAWPHRLRPTRSNQCHSPRSSRLTSAPFMMSTSPATGRTRGIPAARPGPRLTGSRHQGRTSLLVSLGLGMADDVALIRQELETHRASDLERTSPLWTPL